jgi:hypothetical protein
MKNSFFLKQLQLSGMQAQSNSRIANLYQIIEELKNRVNKLELQCAELRSICQQLLIQGIVALNSEKFQTKKKFIIFF